ncbi:MAG: VTC domain-containing protein, partial [Candidatus Melainabacteria bacterium]|nr:VTC domain-containing protein [Candidatus Melainabacteria bacterium]
MKQLESNQDHKPETGFEYYEYKYLVEDARVPEVLQYLRSSISNIDPYPDGWVSSLYYDSYDLKSFYECEDGSNLKRKFRLRFYSNEDYSNGGQIQVKEKQLSAVFKYKAPFPAQPVKDILSQPWPEDIDSLAIRSLATNYVNLEPLILVQYYRHRFRLFDNRITLDTRISFQPGSLLRAPMRSYGHVPFSILEVKAETPRPFLPTNKLIDLPQLSFSKFYSGVKYLQGEDEFFNK